MTSKYNSRCKKLMSHSVVMKCDILRTKMSFSKGGLDIVSTLVIPDRYA